ncbi:hypothetical protein [Thermoanaerobacterium thermosaccharolyticum]|nr:hypothetical protein [Thermoanaerobacterium thermosaccharolyticum]
MDIRVKILIISTMVIALLGFVINITSFEYPPVWAFGNSITCNV